MKQLTTVHDQLQPAQQHLASVNGELNHDMTLIRFAAGKGDLGALFRAINKATQHAQELVSVNKQLSAALESALLTLQGEKDWTDELLRRIELLDPVFLDVVLSADDITVEAND